MSRSGPCGYIQTTAVGLQISKIIKICGSKGGNSKRGKDHPKKTESSSKQREVDDVRYCLMGRHEIQRAKQRHSPHCGQLIYGVDMQGHSGVVSAFSQQTCHQTGACIFILIFTSLKIFHILPKKFNNTFYGFLNS